MYEFASMMPAAAQSAPATTRPKRAFALSGLWTRYKKPADMRPPAIAKLSKFNKNSVNALITVNLPCLDQTRSW